MSWLVVGKKRMFLVTGLILFLGFTLIASYWLLIGSPLLANSSYAIGLRYKLAVFLVEKNLYDKFAFAFYPIYVHPEKISEMYQYKLTGRYDYLDVDASILYLRDELGRAWGVNFKESTINNVPALTFWEYNNESGQFTSTLYIADENAISKGNPLLLVKGDEIRIQWRDSRSLYEQLGSFYGRQLLYSPEDGMKILVSGRSDI